MVEVCTLLGAILVSCNIICRKCNRFIQLCLNILLNVKAELSELIDLFYISAVIARVKSGEKPPFRPEVRKSAAKADLLELMEICWQEDEFARPSFKTIQNKMRKCTE